MNRTLHLVQLAGGKGLRAGGETPKQFRATGSGLLFSVSLTEFLKIPANVGQVASITVTAAEKWGNVVMSVLGHLPLEETSIQRAEPGDTRTESTWNALQVLAEKFDPKPDDLVAVHDAARPFASRQLLTQLMTAAAESGAAVPGIPLADTILQMDSAGMKATYLDRSVLVAVQTPQVFRWDLLFAAHQWAAQNDQSFTDDGSLVAHRGRNPVVIPGEQSNWKVTTDGDWLRAIDIL